MQFTEKFAAEYAKRAHAIQSGVAMTMNHNAKPTEPKHLRTGLNTVMCDLGAVTALLITKGLLTSG